MKQAKELIKKLKEQIEQNELLFDYQIIVQLDSTLEINLLVKQEVNEKELFEKEFYEKYKNVLMIRQDIAENETQYDDNNEKIYFTHRRRLNDLLEQQNKSVEIPVVTFYSYKGGMGRTTALASYASYLSMFHNKKVIIVDCDFEAPGLSNGNYFFLDLGLDNENSKPGIAEYLMDKEFQMHLDGSRPNLKDYCYDEINIAGSANESFTKKDETGKGEIYIIPSGNISDHNQKYYLESLARLDLANELPDFINDVITDFELTLENGVILFDSRTGFNDTFGALAQVSPIIVGLFGINEQNKPGIEFFINNLIIDKKDFIKDKYILFVKGLAENRSEEKKLKKIIQDISDKLELNYSFETSYIKIYDDLKLLGIDLGESEYNEYKQNFREFLIETEIKDNANFSEVFSKITIFVEKFIEGKKPEKKEIIEEKKTIVEKKLPINTKLPISKKIDTWSQNISPQVMIGLKSEILNNFKVPTLSGKDYDDKELANDFYFRVPMHDIFHKNKFLILGSKGSGKTFWYRTLDEKYDYNAATLEKLCKLANKKRSNYIFLNVIDAKNPEEYYKNKGFEKFDEVNQRYFWLLQTYYSIFTHSSIKNIIKFTNTFKDISNQFVVFNQWILDYFDKSMNIIDEKYNEIELNLRQLDNELEKNHKFLILTYDQLDFVVPVQFWKKGISPLIDYWRFHTFKRFLPKIFVRTDLYNKITATNKLELNQNKIDIEWNRDELFAYFYKILLNKSEQRDVYYNYILCYYKASEETVKLINEIEKEFTEFQQIITDENTLRKLVEPCFSKTADTYENDDIRWGNSYDWFFDNLRDALGQTNLRSFWTLLDEAVKEQKVENIRMNKNYPLISPRYYTKYPVREAAGKAYYNELAEEKGNKGLENFLDFYHNSKFQFKRIYQYNSKEFEGIIESFIKVYPTNLESIFENEAELSEKIELTIKWLINNGIVKRDDIKGGKIVKYTFPYFYRGLFRLNRE